MSPQPCVNYWLFATIGCVFILALVSSILLATAPTSTAPAFDTSTASAVENVASDVAYAGEFTFDDAWQQFTQEHGSNVNEMVDVLEANNGRFSVTMNHTVQIPVADAPVVDYTDFGTQAELAEYRQNELAYLQTWGTVGAISFGVIMLAALVVIILNVSGGNHDKTLIWTMGFIILGAFIGMLGGAITAVDAINFGGDTVTNIPGAGVADVSEASPSSVPKNVDITVEFEIKDPAQGLGGIRDITTLERGFGEWNEATQQHVVENFDFDGTIPAADAQAAVNQAAVDQAAAAQAAAAQAAVPSIVMTAVTNLWQMMISGIVLSTLAVLVGWCYHYNASKDAGDQLAEHLERDGEGQPAAPRDEVKPQGHQELSPESVPEEAPRKLVLPKGPISQASSPGSSESSSQLGGGLTPGGPLNGATSRNGEVGGDYPWLQLPAPQQITPLGSPTHTSGHTAGGNRAPEGQPQLDRRLAEIDHESMQSDATFLIGGVLSFLVLAFALYFLRSIRRQKAKQNMPSFRLKHVLVLQSQGTTQEI